MANLELKQISSLEKVFLNREVSAPEYNSASILKGEEFAYQIAYRADEIIDFEVSVASTFPGEIKIYDVCNAPSEFATYPFAEKENYITHEPGLFPDILNKLKRNSVRAAVANRAVWVNVKPDKETAAGIYPVTVTFSTSASAQVENEICESCTFEIEVIDAVLPEQKLVFTQWFHGDCIATYYKEEVFSETHWEHLESFIKTAAEHGINMLLTPVFTPPLDTEIGGERPTIQLVDVYLENGGYSFGFDKLKRWISLCKKCGIRYFEISHLFTQWGAKCTPKIIAETGGVKKRIFGWDTSATSDEYKAFLTAFMPKLTEFLKAEGVAENTYFHVSDEPALEHMDNYTAAANIIKPYIKGFKTIDALSNFDFYKTGAVECPIPALDHIEPFMELEELWTYYCCGEHSKVSNRFFAMPSYRNRILGMQMYKFNIAGFLQWGYNFYYSQYSKYPINPYHTTDAGYAFPSGDAFSVYPGDDGCAIPSLRLKVFFHALQDMRALQLLETMVSKEEITKLLDAEGELKFDSYPGNAEFIIKTREKINELIKKNI